MTEKEKAGDEHMGKFVYCNSHVAPHSTGWCTVPPSDKTPLKAQTSEEAYAEVRAIGFPIYGDKEPIELLGEDVVKALPEVKLEPNYPDISHGKYNKTWYLDLTLDKHVVTVQSSYNYKGLFGVTCRRRRRVLQGGPDESYTRADETTKRVIELLRDKRCTHDD